VHTAAATQALSAQEADTCLSLVAEPAAAVAAAAAAAAAVSLD